MPQNSLAKETSPYLLQHSNNPVDWYSWNESSLNKAKSENKPIFLSIGYSSCHWCHVMAHESFENEDIAEVMNSNFVNIKVDREERPDIDDIYQKVCQIATGQGGWPLSVFLTPDQRPFYVGTYFPPYDHYGRPGFGSLCRQLAQAWKEKPTDVSKAADNFLKVLQKTESIKPNQDLDQTILDEAAMNLLQIADTTYGGFGNAPKFPNSSNISFLFRYWKLSKITKFRDFALLTLRKMANGGIFDQIGGGFHRYATDNKWLVPHFEKMLYDNALIPLNYIEAYQITKDQFYLDVVKKTLDYVIREMTSPQGGFYSAQDADSEGEEGKFYVWSKNEIKQNLLDDADVFCMFYDVTDGGNWEGKTILCNNVRTSTVAFNFNKTEEEIIKILKRSEEKLLETRSKRVWPGRDDKILTAWNALMISAFAKGYRVTGDKRYLESAKNCISFIESSLLNDQLLLRTYKDGKAKIPGYLDDYSYFINALIDTFEVDPQKKYLHLVNSLASYLIDHFWDTQTGSFFMTGDSHEKLIVRPKSNYDLSVPSGNSVAAMALLRLFHLMGEKKYLDYSLKILESQAQAAAENPFGYGYLLNVIYLYLEKPLEITFLGKLESDSYQKLASEFIPNGIFVTIPNPSYLESLSQLRFFSGKKSNNTPTVYVCRDFSCSLPLTSFEEIDKYLD